DPRWFARRGRRDGDREGRRGHRDDGRGTELDLCVGGAPEPHLDERADLLSLVLHAHHVLSWGETLQGLREWKGPRELAIEEQLRPFGALGIDPQRAGEPLRRKQLHR